ncbi:MAG: hypothetical protein ABJO67_06770 [Pseudoruegeria sp.]
MSVRTEKDGPVWAIINDRPEARNAGDPETTDALVESFLVFDVAPEMSVAVFWVQEEWNWRCDATVVSSVSCSDHFMRGTNVFALPAFVSGRG